MCCLCCTRLIKFASLCGVIRFIVVHPEEGILFLQNSAKIIYKSKPSFLYIYFIFNLSWFKFPALFDCLCVILLIRLVCPAPFAFRWPISSFPAPLQRVKLYGLLFFPGCLVDCLSLLIIKHLSSLLLACLIYTCKEQSKRNPCTLESVRLPKLLQQSSVKKLSWQGWSSFHHWILSPSAIFPSPSPSPLLPNFGITSQHGHKQVFFPEDYQCKLSRSAAPPMCLCFAKPFIIAFLIYEFPRYITER